MIKMDLKKAYDHLGWNLIRDLLVDVGLPSSFMGIIYHPHRECPFEHSQNKDITASQSIQ